MNKSIALLLIGVISLAMVLIMLNQGTTTTAQPPLVGVQNPLPQTGMPTSSALQIPANPPAPPAPVQSQKNATAMTTAGLTQVAPQAPQVSTPQAVSPQGSPLATNVQEVSPTAPITQSSTQNTRSTPERAPQPAATSTVKEKTVTAVEKKPTPPPAPPSPPKVPEPKVISKITVSAAGDGANVRIAGTAPLVYKSMHLKSPDRVVVDLEGVWAVKAPGVPNNKAVTNVRIGKQADKTRIVIDLAAPSATVNFTKVNNETLDVRIK